MKNFDILPPMILNLEIVIVFIYEIRTKNFKNILTEKILYDA